MPLTLKIRKGESIYIRQNGKTVAELYLIKSTSQDASIRLVAPQDVVFSHGFAPTPFARPASRPAE
jgi:hypothetical protein